MPESYIFVRRDPPLGFRKDDLVRAAQLLGEADFAIELQEALLEEVPDGAGMFLHGEEFLVALASLSDSNAMVVQQLLNESADQVARRVQELRSRLGRPT